MGAGKEWGVLGPAEGSFHRTLGWSPFPVSDSSQLGVWLPGRCALCPTHCACFGGEPGLGAQSKAVPCTSFPMPDAPRPDRALQENVSCLNTSLVILMLARRKERLPLYLRLLQRMEHSKKYPGFLLNNFHSLLRFWQQHYLHKDKDSTCLENVSALGAALPARRPPHPRRAPPAPLSPPRAPASTSPTGRRPCPSC